MTPTRDLARIPVARILLSAVVAPILHWRRILWFTVPLILVDSVVLIRTQTSIDGAPASAIDAGTIVLVIASFAAGLLLAVACHRIFILGERSIVGQRFVWWMLHALRFLGYTIGISVIAALVAMPFVLLMTPFAASAEAGNVNLLINLAFLPAMYVFTRLSLVLPAVATDRSPDFGWAWNASKSNGIRLLIVIGLWPLLYQLLLLLVTEGQSIVYDAALSLIGVFVVVIEVAALSISYRELTQTHPVPG